MKPKKQQKICYNCNGQVDLEVIVCPFCGTDLLEEFDAGMDLQEEFESKQKSLSPQETVASLYPAPYQVSPENEKEQPPQTTQQSVKKAEANANISLEYIVFIFALNFLSIGILLFIFSSEGKVQLELTSKYWPLFVGIGAFTAFWSFRKIQEE